MVLGKHLDSQAFSLAILTQGVWGAPGICASPPPQSSHSQGGLGDAFQSGIV